MKRGKKIVFGFIFLIIAMVFIIGINFINAETGELATAKPTKVNVTVKASTNPPVVVYVNNATFYNEYYSNNVKECAPGPSSTTFRFDFLGYYDGGESQLPGSTIGEDVSSYVLGNFSYGSKVRNIVKCFYRNVASNYDGLGLGHDAKNYTCNVTMWYSDDPQPNAWTMKVQIKTLASSGSLWSLVNSTQTFRLNKVANTILDVSSVNWTTNSITANTLNTPADNVINVINYGNLQINTGSNYKLRINATSLIGETTPTFTFGATNFSAQGGTGNAGCAASAFNEAQWSDLTFVLSSAPNPPTQYSGPLAFCAKTANDIQPQAYDSGANPWQIDDYCNGCLA